MATKRTEPDLDPWKEQEDRKRRSSRNRRFGGFAAAAGIVAIAVVAVVLARTDDEQGAPPPSARASTGTTLEPRLLSIVDVRSGSETEFTTPRGALGFDVTLDGSMITYTDLDENGSYQVFVMDADGSNTRQLTHGTRELHLMGSPPQWSPDGSEYPLVARSIDLETGRTETIARDVSTPEPSPDGTQIAFDSYYRPEGESWLSVMNIDGTNRRKLLQASYEGSFPRWSPDNTQIAYTGDTDGDGYGTYVYVLATGETRFVTAGTVECWIDDDRILVS